MACFLIATGIRNVLKIRQEINLTSDTQWGRGVLSCLFDCSCQATGSLKQPPHIAGLYQCISTLRTGGHTEKGVTFSSLAQVLFKVNYNWGIKNK